MSFLHFVNVVVGSDAVVAVIVAVAVAIAAAAAAIAAAAAAAVGNHDQHLQDTYPVSWF